MAQVIGKHLLTKITSSDQLKNRHIDSQNKSSYFYRAYDYIDSTLQHLSQHESLVLMALGSNQDSDVLAQTYSTTRAFTVHTQMMDIAEG